MSDRGLAAVLGAAILFAARCTILPGIEAVIISWFRGRPRVDRPAVLGPLFWYELTRLARRGQQPKLRALYAGVLLVGLLVTYLNEFHEVNPIRLVLGGEEMNFPLDRMASFSQRFLATFLFCQLAGVILITPVYAGGAIPEERDRGTLDFLRSSLLTNREIVAAVLTARLLFVVGLVLTGLPVLGLTMLFGGVDLGQLAGGFVVALMTVLSLGTFCLYLGVRGRGLREVLIWVNSAVALVAVFGACCWCLPVLGTSSPFTATYMLLNPPSGPGPGWYSMDVMVGLFVATHGTLAMIFTWRATALIRVPAPAWVVAASRARRRAATRAPATPTSGPRHSLPVHPSPELDTPGPRRRERPALRSFRVPRLGAEDPLLWKERYFSGRMPGVERGMLSGCAAMAVVLVVFPIGLWLFVAVFELVAKGQDPAGVLNPIAKTVGYAAAVALAPAVGIRAAGAVARERERQTLDALLSLPIPRARVLRAKWLAPLLWTRYWLAGVGAVILVAGAFGSVHLLGLVVGVALLGAFIPFANTLGLWLSVRCQSATRAVTWFAVVLIGLFLAPLLLSTLTRSAFQLAGDEVAGTVAEQFVDAASVPNAVYEALFRWGEFRRTDGDRHSLSVVSGLVAAAVYGVAGWVLWRDAVRRFEREGK